MVFKACIVFCLVAVGCGSVVPLVPTVARQSAFSYGVQDLLTGDVQSRQEVRTGDVVSGSYSVLDADGLHRTVDYSADPLNGFNAVVQRQPAVVAPVVPYAAPLGNPYAAPLAKSVYLNGATPVLSASVSGPVFSQLPPGLHVASPLVY